MLKRNQKRKFPTYEEAKAYLEERGTLEYFGRAGSNYEYCVYNFTLPTGKKYGLDVYDSGLVVVRNEFN